MPDKGEHDIAMMGPDGGVIWVAPKDVPQAMLLGGTVAQRMKGPDGHQIWVAPHDVEEGMSLGGVLVQQNGEEYPEGTQPVIVGHNSAGQPIFGSAPEPANAGFWKSAGEAFVGGAKGLLAMIDPRATAEEKQAGLTSWYDYVLRPAERMVGAQAEQVVEAMRLARESEASMRSGDQKSAQAQAMSAMTHGLAAAIPVLGPMAEQVSQRMAEQVAEGDYAGAVGTFAGNAALAEAAEAGAKGTGEVIRTLPARFAEWQAPTERLGKPIGEGEMSPLERYEAAERMGVHLDRAQATAAPGPAIAKRATEQSLLGSGAFARNTEANLRALHGEAGRILEEAHPDAISREEAGRQVQQALQRHHGELKDEPGMRREAQDLLNRIDKRDMDAQQFGEEAQQALKQHQESMYNRASEFLTGALERQGARVRTGNVEDVAQKIYDENEKHFKQFPEALKLPGMRLAWDWVNRLRPREWKGEGAKRLPLPARSLPPADVVKLRSELWNLYQSKDLVGSQAEGWLKQLVGSLDDSLTDPANEKGMTPAEIQKFRAGTTLWKRMKSMYDDPQSPFFSILRSPEPMTVAGTLEKLKPTAAQQFREAMGDVSRKDLVRAQQRQIVRHVLDPADNGETGFAGLPARFARLPKEQIGELLDPEHVNALGSLADRVQDTTPYEAAGSHLKQVLAAPDGTLAYRAMISDQGKLRLTPQEIRQIQEADPHLIPMLQRQAISHQLDPAENGTADLRNFPARWTRDQKTPLGTLLTPDQMQRLDELSAVSRVVHADTNPSGTAKTLQPAAEVGRLVEGGTGAVLGGVAGGPLGAAAGAVMAPLADTAARGAIARRLVNPEATAKVMEHTAPEPVSSILKRTAAESAAGKIARAGAGVAARMPELLRGESGEAQIPRTLRDQFGSMARRRGEPPPSMSPESQPAEAGSVPERPGGNQSRHVEGPTKAQVQNSIDVKRAIALRDTINAENAYGQRMDDIYGQDDWRAMPEDQRASAIENDYDEAQDQEKAEAIRAERSRQEDDELDKRVAYVDAKQADVENALRSRGVQFSSRGRDNYSRYIDASLPNDEPLQIRVSDHAPPAGRGGYYRGELGDEYHDPSDLSFHPGEDDVSRLHALLDRKLSLSPNAAPTAPIEQPASLRDRFGGMMQRRNQAGGAMGVSTPPNGGQIENVNVAEPNEVHDPAKAAAIEQEEQQRPSGRGFVNAPRTTMPKLPGGRNVDVYTGASSSGEPGAVEDTAPPSPQAMLGAPPGATHSVHDGETGELLGHMVDGGYVPLTQKPQEEEEPVSA